MADQPPEQPETKMPSAQDFADTSLRDTIKILNDEVSILKKTAVSSVTVAGRIDRLGATEPLCNNLRGTTRLFNEQAGSTQVLVLATQHFATRMREEHGVQKILGAPVDTVTSNMEKLGHIITSNVVKTNDTTASAQEKCDQKFEP